MRMFKLISTKRTFASCAYVACQPMAATVAPYKSVKHSVKIVYVDKLDLVRMIA
jgi:hypothetical protein